MTVDENSIEPEKDNQLTGKWAKSENKKLFIQAVADGKSISDVCRNLGLVARGANFTTVKIHITRLGLDTSHHIDNSWKEHHRYEGNTVNNEKLRKQLVIKRGHKCEECQRKIWNKKEIKLTVEHKDGNIFNDNIDNLLLLCPNCHSQTTTWKTSRVKNTEDTTQILPSNKEIKAIVEECFLDKKNLTQTLKVLSGKNIFWTRHDLKKFCQENDISYFHIYPSARKKGILWEVPDEEFAKKVKTTISIRALLASYNLEATGSNRRRALLRIKELGLDISHHKGQGWSKGQYKNEDYVAKESLKNWLLRERGNKCEKCRRGRWNGKIIPLETEHIDGNNKNNEPDNLLLLCPNCHAYTDTWCRKKSVFDPDEVKEERARVNMEKKEKRQKEARERYKEERLKKGLPIRTQSPKGIRKSKYVACPQCSGPMHENASLCKKCYNTHRPIKTDYLPAEVIQKLVNEDGLSLVRIGKLIGVSDNGVKKFLKRNGYQVSRIPTPGRGWGSWIEKDD